MPVRMTGNIVTGASGFVGKHLLKKLKSYTTIPHQDIQKFEIKKPSCFYFLSAYGNMNFHKDENEIIKANLLDLAHVIRNIIWENKPTFVFISTSSVKLEHQTFYSRTKKMAEELLLAYLEKYDAPILIIRPMSITGVGEQKEHLIPKLIDSCLNDNRMPFVAEPVHDFIDVKDFLDAVMILVKAREKGIFEIGRGRSYTNDMVRRVVEKVTGKKANLNRVDSLRSYDNTSWVSKNLKIRDYGWKPTKTLTQSIKEMVRVCT